MQGIGGIAGLSTGLTRDSDQLLVPALYDAGVISEPVFGWYLTDMTGQSYMDVGFIGADAIRDGEEIAWLPVVNNDFWWTNYITGISFNGQDYSINKSLGMTDTGTSCTYVPHDFW